MNRTFNSIEQLASTCATDIGVGTCEPLHPAFCKSSDFMGGIKEQRRVVDMVCGLGVTYLEAKRPQKTGHDEDRFIRKVRRRAEKTARERDVDKTGFAPLILIGGAIVTWLIQKALDWLLAWWRGTPTAPENVKAMCVGLPGAGWSEDTDDD